MHSVAAGKHILATNAFHVVQSFILGSFSTDLGATGMLTTLQHLDTQTYVVFGRLIATIGMCVEKISQINFGIVSTIRALEHS
jgi:hypothetical protein